MLFDRTKKQSIASIKSEGLVLKKQQKNKKALQIALILAGIKRYKVQFVKRCPVFDCKYNDKLAQKQN